MTEKMPLAVVTMAYNERVMLPIWLRHYARQVGTLNCFVLDHGSDDGSTTGIEANILRFPRSSLRERERAEAISDFCASLFYHYDCVLYTDADEIVVADPQIAPTLSDFARNPGLPDTITLFGMDVLHDERREGPLDLDRPLLAQRALYRPFKALFKPTFIRSPKQWVPGFHLGDETPHFNDLYLFHIAYADNGIASERQAKRNTSPPVRGGGEHHFLLPGEIVEIVRGLAASTPPQQAELDDRFCDRYFRSSDMDRPDVLWHIPERFKSAF